ncbi:MAG TPA: EhbH [Methanothermobacter sp.]|nr:energy-converting hydrogenase B, subunit H [Methanothermobacter sp. MT-2]HHW04838.1 EhbH [Methanothermobacter sp.]HOK72138.1 EhbH [Methanothermobacter sp.]HOL68451.1 EhbH [Methanothermobacter sp.]HPQ04209.1 EhbH [Methanothermobacter sp.]
MSRGIRGLIATFSVAIFGITLFDAIIGLHRILNPGISYIYNYVGTRIAPNMVTIVVFDWRGYDTLGEALILVTAVIVTLLIFGRGKVELGGK